jgi:hypothetical protein
MARMRSMFFLVFGSSGAGKTVALSELHGRIPRLAVHEFDEIGVPPGADTAWRQRANEGWVRRALAYQSEGIDILLAGQTPLGELLATPSARFLEAVSACLLDCDDATRRERLLCRGPEWFKRSAAEVDAYLNWARWMRGHARDPSWQPEVIRHGDLVDEMEWERWSAWEAGDSRWRVHVIDTSDAPVARVAEALAAWVEDERALFRAGKHPLAQANKNED